MPYQGYPPPGLPAHPAPPYAVGQSPYEDPVAVPREKRNPCIVHCDLDQADGRELRRALEQLTRALVGRLDACEKIHEQMTEVMRRHNERVVDRRSIEDTRGRLSTFTPVPDHVPAPRKNNARGIRKALFISCGTGLTYQQAFLRFLQNLGYSPEATFLTTNDTVDKSEFPNPTASNLIEGLRWLVQIHPGESVLFHFIGRASETALFPSDGDHHGNAIRQALAEAMLSIHSSSRMLAIIDTGDMGTPLELPFSVVAHHAPGGFEMTTGDEEERSGHVQLISTYAERAGDMQSSGAGVLSAAIQNVLNQAIHPTYRALASTLLWQLEKRLGRSSPVPLLSSNRAFHPESEFDIF